MTIAEESLLKQLVQQMVFNRLDDKGVVLFQALKAGVVKVDDIAEPQKNVFRRLVHDVKSDIACYVESSSRGNVGTDWEVVI